MWISVVAACGKGSGGGDKTGYLVNFNKGGYDEMDLRFSVGGKDADDLWMLELAALPAAGATYEVFVETPCGRASTKVPFPQQPDLLVFDITSGKYAGMKEAKVQLSTIAGLEAKETRIFIDPKLTGKVLAGKVPLANDRPAYNVDCVKELSINGTAVPMPALRPDTDSRSGILVTDRPDACFRDESVGYGDQGTSGDTLKGARAYTLRSRHYLFLFREPDPNASVNMRQSGTALEALREVPCAATP